MNYNATYLLNILNYNDIDDDKNSVTYYQVELNPNNIYGLPSKPEGHDYYSYLTFYGNEIWICVYGNDSKDDIYKTFDVTKLTVKESQ